MCCVIVKPYSKRSIDVIASFVSRHSPNPQCDLFGLGVVWLCGSHGRQVLVVETALSQHSIPILVSPVCLSILRCSVNRDILQLLQV